MSYEARIEECAGQLGDLVQQNISLANMCTYKVGGSADLYTEVNSVDDLTRIFAATEPYELPILIIGKGSNLLVADSGFRGIAVRLGSGFGKVEIDTDSAIVISGANELLPVVARKTAASSLSGFEWAVGVPGSIGGAVRMNAGGHGSDMAASVSSMTIFDLTSGESSTMLPKDWQPGYRKSGIQPSQVVLEVVLQLSHGTKEKSEAEISEIVRWRRAHQPGGQNAGSVFANPEGDYAARIIEECGLKGVRIGTAQVSDKHSNFIQADPKGNADDVFRVLQHVRTEVASQTGILLHPENKLIGFEQLV